jgi:CopG family nickel-responsive transcriptional regulator
MSELVRMSVSIEKPLFRNLERMIRGSRYTNRSEFLRDLIRERLVEEEWQHDREVVATITLVYDHHVRLLNRKLTDLQHDHHGRILASTHVHLDKHMCAEMIMLKGRAGEIKQIGDLLRQQKGVFHAGLSMSSTGKMLG